MTKSSSIRLADGRTMAYAIYGDQHGLPLIALHGTPGSHLMIRPGDDIASQKGIMLIAPDRPGYGRSSACPGYRLEQWVEDMKILLDHLGIDRFLGLGISGGGPFTMALAALLPQRVKALALVSPVGQLTDKLLVKNLSPLDRFKFKTLPAHPYLSKPLYSILRLAISKRPKATLKSLALSLCEHDRDILADTSHQQELIATFNDGLQAGVSGLTDDMHIFSSSWELPLHNALMPVMIWHGKEDHQVPLEGSLKLLDELPTARIRQIEKAGHFWIFNHFDEVLEWLKNPT